MRRRIRLSSQEIARTVAALEFIGELVSGAASHVLTGDSDLLSLGEHEGISIVTPRAFMEYSATKP